MGTGRLKAGAAERDITPAPGGKLAVEMTPQTAARVKTPLMAKALVLANETQTLALVTLDLYGLERGAARRAQAAVAARLGIGPEAVMMVCSHTRGGPYTTPVVGAPDVDAAAVEAVERVLPELAAEAQAALQDASLGVGQVRVPHLVYNHRLLTRNMKAVTAWLGVPKNEVLEPEGPVDPAFDVLVIRDRKGFPIALAWNFAADNRFPEGENGGGAISAGLPYVVQQEIDARAGKHIPLLYLPGCGANVSFTLGLDASAEHVASAVMAAYLETTCDPEVRLDCRAETVILPTRDSTCFWSQPDIELKAPWAVEAFAREVEYLQQEKLPAVAAQVQAFRLGRFALAALPGVPFVELGLAVKAASPAQGTLVAGNAGGHLGYLITEQAFHAEGFEAWTARSALVGRGGGEFAAAETTRLLKRLWKG
jgi:hypothetical protein